MLFKPQELRNELQSLKELATPLLDRSTIDLLDRIDSDLAGLLTSGGDTTIEIPQNRPLRTRLSEGEFEPPSKNCGRRIYGEITGKWEVSLKKGGKKKKTKSVEFCGVASTVIKLFDEGNGADAIATWKIEIGDADAPGCYFHTHAGASSPDLPVPRHPSLFATPMAAIAFALGEVFQEAWEDAVSGTAYHPNQWRSIQKRRLTALLKWKLQKIETTTSSPWLSLKSETPSPELFLQ